jgi:drug/metabolite transporter (DMT)-like permease
MSGMGLLYVLLSIFAEGAGKTIDKLNFRRNRVAAQQLVFIIFIVMSLSLTAFVLLTHQAFPHFSLATLGLVALIAVVSFGSNVFEFLSLKADDLSLREPLCDFQPLAAGLIGYMLFPAERKPGFLLAFVLGGIIVYYGTHRRKLRRLQKKGMTYLLIGISLEAFLPSLYMVTLNHLAPAYVSLFRVVSVLALTSLFFPPKSRAKLTSKRSSYAVASGFIYAGGALASMYAIKELGVVLSMLLMLLGPALHYFSGYFILKENVRRGELASSLLLAVLITVTALR